MNPTLRELIQKAAELGTDELEIDSKDGQERVCAMRGSMGVGIGSVKSSPKESEQLFAEIAALKKSKRVDVGATVYRASVSEFDSFGETAYRIKLTKMSNGCAPAPGRP